MYASLVYPDKWTAAIQKGYTMKTLAQVYDPDTGTTTDLEIIEGETHHDKTAPIRSRCSVHLTDPTGSLTPEDADGLLAPYGNEVKLYRGIDYLDGTSDLVPLGVYGIEDLRITDARDRYSLQIEGLDRVARIQRARFVNEYVVAAGQNYVVAIENLLQTAMPGIEFWNGNNTTTETTPTLTFEAGSDPHKAASDMCDAIGFQMPFFDGNGYCRLVLESDPTTAPVTWTYAEDQVSIYLSGERNITRDGISNHFIVTGETTSNETPVRAEAEDTDSDSPTYTGGKFGRVTSFFASQFVRTTDQAQAAANRRLWNMKGRQEDLHFNQIVNSAHEVGDVIAVTRSRLKLNNARYVIDKLSIPMIYMRAMDVQTRRVF